MPEYEYAGHGRVSEEDYAEASRAANEYSVSLINGNDLKGSATLVSIGDTLGLLTADHVWRAVLKGEAKDHFCMVLSPHLQRFEYPFEGCTSIIVGKYSPDHAEQGPDLTFVRLDNPEKLQTIESKKSFYPLDPAKGKMSAWIPHDRSLWIVWGAPGEQSSRSSTSRGEGVLTVTHFAGWGEFVGKVDRDGFDYVKLKMTSGSYNYPNDYGGVSGGGAWVPIRFVEDHPEGKVLKPTLSVLLAGVAYYQIEEEVDYKTLILHGPISIYERVIQAVLHPDERA